ELRDAVDARALVADFFQNASGRGQHRVDRDLRARLTRRFSRFGAPSFRHAARSVRESTDRARGPIVARMRRWLTSVASTLRAHYAALRLLFNPSRLDAVFT